MSESSQWGKSEGERGLFLRMWMPTQDYLNNQCSSSSSSSSTEHKPSPRKELTIGGRKGMKQSLLSIPKSKAKGKVKEEREGVEDVLRPCSNFEIRYSEEAAACLMYEDEDEEDEDEEEV